MPRPTARFHRAESTELAYLQARVRRAAALTTEEPAAFQVDLDSELDCATRGIAKDRPSSAWRRDLRI